MLIELGMENAVSDTAFVLLAVELGEKLGYMGPKVMLCDEGT